MKSFLLASVATLSILAVGGAASAADMRMPMKAPMLTPAPTPVSAWSGCFIGGHVGLGQAHTTWSDTVAGTGVIDPLASGRSVKTDMSGALYGGQIGCDFQFAGPLVFGVEGALSGTNLDDSAADPFRTTWTLGSSHDWLGSVTGRIGFSFNHALIYARGGVAWADTQFEILNGGILDGNPSKTRQGWVVGGGLEYAFMPAWSLFVEGDYYTFNNTGVNFAGDVIHPTLPFGISSKENIEAIKLGVNYRFGNIFSGAAF